MAFLKLGRQSEAVECLSRVLGLCRARDADYRTDKSLVQCLIDCKYASVTKMQSANWSKVKFKDSCVVVDPLGAGDYKCISDCFPLISKEVG